MRGARRGARAPAIWSVCLLIVVGACGEDSTAPVGPAEPDTVVHAITMRPSSGPVPIGMLDVSPL